MRKFLIIVTSFCFIFLLFACVKDTYDWEECHPRIFIRFDWSTVVKPGDDEKVNVVIAGESRDTTFMQITPDGQEVRLTPQVYDFIGYTAVDNVTVSGRTVTVRQDATGNYVEPHDFSGGAVSQEIIRTDQDQTVTIPMRQQTRPLIIRVILRGNALGGFSHITAEISDIAMSRDINNGFVPLDNEPLHSAYTTGVFPMTLPGKPNLLLKWCIVI
ncbi:MAG: FimB/Mfa2 family fimbrial subunit [Tannerellaceae bacterium]|nr:FimB/Mfa2 family fimbrial subunit [Tannerellaceae bacterium]